MSEIQVVTLVATCFGLIATVLNLVAFVREKDKSHTKAGLSFLFVLLLSLGLLFLPRYAPDTAQRLVSALPTSVAHILHPWLHSSAEVAAPQPEVPNVQGAFTIEIQRNFFGGIGALVANFQFHNATAGPVKVIAYHIRITSKVGESARSYDRVMTDPAIVGANETGKAQVELDAEIRDQWVAREGLDAAERGSIEVSWDCRDQHGQQFRVTSTNG